MPWEIYIIRSQEKNLNQNRDSNLGPPVNKMTDSVMTAPPGKSGIYLKREIWTWPGMRTGLEIRRSEVRIPVLDQIFLLRSYNVNFPRHKLWVCFQLIIWFKHFVYLFIYLLIYLLLRFTLNISFLVLICLCSF